MSHSAETARHWDAVYEQGDSTRSWYQEKPRVSLELLDRAESTAQDSLIDVGGGASTLVDALLERGWSDVTVLDVSEAGLQIARERLGPDAARVQWLVQDLLTWQPDRHYRVWHDRAVLHFLTDAKAREQYRRALHAATATGSVAVVAAFSPNGPTRCSGLPVIRFSAADIAAYFGPGWAPVMDREEAHRTPSGSLQAFTWAVFRRRD